MTAPTEQYRRNLDLNLVATFRPGSRIHGQRLTELQDAVEKAFAEAMAEQLPNAIADVHSTLEWRYVFKEDSREYQMGPSEKTHPVPVKRRQPKQPKAMTTEQRKQMTEEIKSLFAESAKDRVVKKPEPKKTAKPMPTKKPASKAAAKPKAKAEK